MEEKNKQQGEEGIDWCPYCGEDLIRNVGNNYGCNSCDREWEIRESSLQETFCENCNKKIFTYNPTDMDFCNECKNKLIKTKE